VLPRSKEALLFASRANASALPLFPTGGETDWRVRSTGPQDSVSAAAGPGTDPDPKPHQRRPLLEWAVRQGSVNLLARNFRTATPTAWRLRMKPMTTKREVRRMIRQQSAWIMNGEAITECEIMDISMRGAKIVPQGSSVVPARFELAFSPEDNKRQACEVIWRRGRMLGIKFVS
jgi:hypothetical protein